MPDQQRDHVHKVTYRRACQLDALEREAGAEARAQAVPGTQAMLKRALRARPAEGTGPHTGERHEARLLSERRIAESRSPARRCRGSEIAAVAELLSASSGETPLW
jgi:hypothetical protein